MDVKQFFTDFPWVRSFVVSLFASGIFFLAGNPSYVPNITISQMFQAFYSDIIQYVAGIVALLGFLTSIASLYFQKEQRKIHSKIKQELIRETGPSNRSETELGDIKRTPEELLAEHVNRIDDCLWISEEGDVNITEMTLGEVQRMLLYLVGKRYAFELDLVDSPKVSSVELSNGAKIPHTSIIGWYFPLEDIIVKTHYDDYHRFNDYTINTDDIPVAIDYIKGDRGLPEGNVIAGDFDSHPQDKEE